MLFLFISHKSKIVKKIGVSLSLSVLIFVTLKYLFGIDCSRIYTFIIFTICLACLIIIDRKKYASNYRKNL